MDRALATRFITCQAPFAGHTLHPETMVQADVLSSTLVGLVASLRSLYGKSGLFSLVDLHEVDGSVGESLPMDWDELGSFVESSDALYEGRAPGTLRYRSFYDEGFNFYLRVLLMDYDEDPEYPGSFGTFDLSMSEVETYAGSLVVPCETVASMSYFARRSAA